MSESARLFARAKRYIPGGVNSPVRAFHGVGGEPLFFNRGEGAWLFDADGKKYADYVCSWGALLVGHAHPAVVQAVNEAVAAGLGFGAPTERECRFAETLCAAMPSMELVRAVSSGTEATMSAIRVARGYTKRDILVKFANCYHGHADSLLVAAGSGALTLGVPSSSGVPKSAVADTVVLPYNDTQQVVDFFARQGDKVAAVIVEPIAGNMNLIRPDKTFLLTLREQCDKSGAVLIFDEVMTGFRVDRGGAQALFDIRPDLTCLGKVIGGGLNVAAFGGRQAVMDVLAPLGDVYQAGTLSGNPVALAAGLATLEIILADGFYDTLNAIGERLTDGINAIAADTKKPLSAQSVGGMVGIYCRDTPPHNFAEMSECDINCFRAFFHAMLACGVYLAPSAYEAGFIGSAHDEEVIDYTLTAVRDSLAKIA